VSIYSGSQVSAVKTVVINTTSYNTAYPIICLNIFLVIIYSDLEWGFLVKRAGVGGSVANAREAKVSIIRLTHSI